MTIFATQTFRPISRSLLASAKRASATIGGINAVRNLSTTAGQLVFGFAYFLGEVAALSIILKAALLILILLLGVAIRIKDMK